VTGDYLARVFERASLGATPAEPTGAPDADVENPFEVVGEALPADPRTASAVRDHRLAPDLVGDVDRDERPAHREDAAAAPLHLEPARPSTRTGQGEPPAPSTPPVPAASAALDPEASRPGALPASFDAAPRDRSETTNQDAVVAPPERARPRTATLDEVDQLLFGAAGIAPPPSAPPPPVDDTSDSAPADDQRLALAPEPRDLSRNSDDKTFVTPREVPAAPPVRPEPRGPDVVIGSVKVEIVDTPREQRQAPTPWKLAAGLIPASRATRSLGRW